MNTALGKSLTTDTEMTEVRTIALGQNYHQIRLRILSGPGPKSRSMVFEDAIIKAFYRDAPKMAARIRMTDFSHSLETRARKAEDVSPLTQVLELRDMML